MDPFTAGALDALINAGLVNVKRRAEFTAERAVTGAAPYVVTVVIQAETVTVGTTTYVVTATRAGRSHSVVGTGTSVEAAISALTLSSLD